MAGRRLTAVFLTLILSLHAGAAHAFSLLPAEETAGAYSAGGVHYASSALDEKAPASANSATPPAGQK